MAGEKGTVAKENGEGWPEKEGRVTVKKMKVAREKRKGWHGKIGKGG